MSETNADRFLTAFASIETSLNCIVGSNHYRSFGMLLSDCAKRNRIVRAHMEDLREYAELRNAIVHQRDRDFEIIAEPSDRVTADIEQIAVQLMNQSNMLNYASTPVQRMKPEDRIEDAYQQMNLLNTTKIPVYEGRHYVGLLTLEQVAHWGLYRDTEDKVGEIMTKGLNERVIFVPKDISFEHVLRQFDQSIRSGKKTPAIIITEHGNGEELPMGIITTQDLPKVLSVFAK